ncbi:CRISPR-associated endoribonuclease Cas6 [Thermoanaerobacterium sp. RBIITD]|uniref:CRISPR-associated endoribonuclease Cas6 n=1 Tax=Thermoanaerobacterium sp. RBIITD TaxID=1550240 RepID=UPI000BB6FD1D|nr:CRISPR-associated endoribonuclease Cas6 [Thermoanaerobacterium sp. RBIITD]SNX53618.1 CRISPR-associated endoribonuclease Cas6 [Thermoanaerobacterium sp. RBIITD]
MFRLRLEFQFRERAVYFDKNYKENISNFFRKAFKCDYFVFSDLIPIRKKVADDGFWGINKGALYFNTPFIKDKFYETTKLPEESIMLKYGQIKINKVILLNSVVSVNGYVLSPIMATKDDKYIEYEKEPEFFNYILREKLIKKYQKIYGNMPEDDRFIFFFRGTPEKIISDGFVAYRGPYQIYGSDELINLAYNGGLGDYNELGYGMISNDLYFWKKNI